ncbi:1296_t:CDS:2 [Funneliformis mosseae]|uniref:1296_t:CDS:1 n=1 Tax=Funneliformis mosseae TaxID=27381 RepID=A0A9N8ZTV0_FUNMO|nr:1296_t:CDS:2 [Funneliformis mosseae]
MVYSNVIRDEYELQKRQKAVKEDDDAKTKSGKGVQKLKGKKKFPNIPKAVGEFNGKNNDDGKEDTKGASKVNNTKPNPKDNPKDPPKENPKENPKDNAKDNPKENPKENPQGNKDANPKSKNEYKDPNQAKKPKGTPLPLFPDGSPNPNVPANNNTALPSTATVSNNNSAGGGEIFGLVVGALVAVGLIGMFVRRKVTGGRPREVDPELKEVQGADGSYVQKPHRHSYTSFEDQEKQRFDTIKSMIDRNPPLSPQMTPVNNNLNSRRPYDSSTPPMTPILNPVKPTLKSTNSYDSQLGPPSVNNSSYSLQKKNSMESLRPLINSPVPSSPRNPQANSPNSQNFPFNSQQNEPSYPQSTYQGPSQSDQYYGGPPPLQQLYPIGPTHFQGVSSQSSNSPRSLEDPPHSPSSSKGEPVPTDNQVLSSSVSSSHQDQSNTQQEPSLVMTNQSDNISDSQDLDINKENDNDNINQKVTDDDEGDNLSTNSNNGEKDALQLPDLQPFIDLEDMMSKFTNVEDNRLNNVDLDEKRTSDLPPPTPNSYDNTVVPGLFSKDSSTPVNDNSLTSESRDIQSNDTPEDKDRSASHSSSVNSEQGNGSKPYINTNIFVNQNAQIENVQPIQGMIQIENLDDHKITKNNTPPTNNESDYKQNVLETSNVRAQETRQIGPKQDLPMESDESENQVANAPILSSPQLKQSSTTGFIKPVQSSMIIGRVSDESRPIMKSSPGITSFKVQQRMQPETIDTVSSFPEISAPIITETFKPATIIPNPVVAPVSQRPVPPRFDIDAMKRHLEKVKNMKAAIAGKNSAMNENHNVVNNESVVDQNQNQKIKDTTEDSPQQINNDKPKSETTSNKENQGKPLVRKKSVRFQADLTNQEEAHKVQSKVARKSILINKDDVINIQVSN